MAVNALWFPLTPKGRNRSLGGFFPRRTQGNPDGGAGLGHRAVELGAGEIVLNSIDADGTKPGYDLEITRRISEAISVPVVASGGAGNLEHMAEVLEHGKADAVLAASIFHFGEFTVEEVKQHLHQKGIPVRLKASAA